MWRGSDCWVWGGPVLRREQRTGAGVSMGQGTAVGVSGKGVCCREPGLWDMAGKALCCASGLGKHWDGWEISSREVVVVCGRRALRMGWLGVRLWKCCASERWEM